MKILFTICGRKGSKGLKNKNISKFLEYPISYYTLSAYQLFKNKHPEHNCYIALNTDSTELVEQVANFGEKFTHIERTEELAGDKAGKVDVIRDTYEKMNIPFDVIIDLDITSPLRAVSDIEGVLNCLLAEPKADLAFSITTSRRSPYFNQVKKYEDGFFKPVKYMGATTRQEVPSVFDMNASIYAYKPDFLLKHCKLFDGRTVAYEMKDTAVLDIDNPEDKELMEVLARYFYNHYPELNEIYKNISNS